MEICQNVCGLFIVSCGPSGRVRGVGTMKKFGIQPNGSWLSPLISLYTILCIRIRHLLHNLKGTDDAKRFHCVQWSTAQESDSSGCGAFACLPLMPVQDDKFDASPSLKRKHDGELIT